MKPRPPRATVRQTARAEVSYQTYTFPGPSGGWVSDQNLTIAQPSCATRLENIFPTATGGILRRGCSRHTDISDGEISTKLSGTVDLTETSPAVTGNATSFTTELSEGDTVRIDGNLYTVDTITDNTSMTLEEDALADATGADVFLITSAASLPVEAIISYDPGGSNKLFAVTDEAVWDVSVTGSPALGYTLTSGNVISAGYTTVNGDKYIRGVNGQDIPFVYDGSSFSTSPALTFASPDGALSPSILSFTWVFKNRFFFIERDSLNVWYLPVGQIGGELTKFSLGGEFTRGGKLVFGASWSMDAGDGLSSMCVFFTDQGEVAVYAGSDPSQADAWSRVGVYMVGRPRGPRSFVHRGGDLLIATDVGLIPLSSALQRDAATVALTAVSSQIEDKWRDFVRTRPGDWPMDVWTANQMLIIALPTSINGEPPVWLVANVRTNRWCVYTGWDALSVCVHGDRAFFGSPDGVVYEANVGATDDGLPFTGIYVPVFDQLGVAGLKAPALVRAVTRSLGPANVQLTAQSDFITDLPAAPDATPITSVSDKWGAAKWGSARWSASNTTTLIEDYWVHVVGTGEVISVAHQITSGGLVPIDVEFIRTDVLFTSGGVQS